MSHSREQIQYRNRGRLWKIAGTTFNSKERIVYMKCGYIYLSFPKLPETGDMRSLTVVGTPLACGPPCEWHPNGMQHGNRITIFRCRQNGHFACSLFKSITSCENVCIWIKISLKLFPRVYLTTHQRWLVVVFRRTDNTPLFEPMVA